MPYNIEIWKSRLEKAQIELLNEVKIINRKKIEKKINLYSVKINKINDNKINDNKYDRKDYNCLNQYDNNNNEIIVALKNSIKMYYINGARSSAKLQVLHSFINCIINYKLKSLDQEIYKNVTIYSYPVKELKVRGIIYDKNVDITVKYKSRIIGIISVKFIMSNYSQNNINYMETMMGECLNLKTNKKNRIFWHPIFIFDKIPYYDKNNNIRNIEKIKLNKYNNLMDIIINNKEENNLLPDNVSITIINNKDELIHPIKLDENLDNYINNLIDIDNPFIDIDKIYDFVYNLDNFCNKIINNCKNITHSIDSTNSS